jgi:predicted AAA+ superfamily ATPase
MFNRCQILSGRGKESVFLWGARQTGKSTLLKKLFPDSPRYDLLLADVYQSLSARPSRLRESLLANPISKKLPVIIDEVQKIPALLDEIQWLIVNEEMSFILSGSSPRKIIRSGGNMLGGRALRYELFPLVSAEIPDFDLLRALNHGMLPRHYIADDPSKMIASYLGDYLKEEIAAEAVARQVPSFARFLESSAFSNGEMVNFSNIACECGISSPTVRGYFQILEDTLIGRFLQAYQKRPKRRVVLAPKFYYFDVALANHLLKRGYIAFRSEAFGKAFEHFIFQEIWAHRHYSGLDYPVAYWRTTSQLEVDFILGDHQVAVEVKGTETITSVHLKGLKAFAEEYKIRESILVSLEPSARKVGGILILPWKQFLQRLWSGDLIK